MACPKCHKESGDDWSQCINGCPMPASPYYSEESEAPGRANVATYDDWFPDAPIVAQQQCGVCGEPQYSTPSGMTCVNGHGGARPAYRT